MSWHVTTESTQEPSHSSVVIVIDAFLGVIILHYTWNGTSKKSLHAYDKQILRTELQSSNYGMMLNKFLYFFEKSNEMSRINQFSFLTL